MPPTTTDPLTADTAFSTATLALSKSQRLLASWAPPSSPSPPPPHSRSHPYKTTPQQQEQKEEDEQFTPLSELAGLGARVNGKDKEEGKRRDRDIDALERLRREILGKGKGKGARKKCAVEMSSRAVSIHAPIPARIPVNPPPQKHKEEEEEEESGRSSLGNVRMRGGSRDGDEEGEEGVLEGKAGQKARQKKRGRGGGYLDEVLAARAVKRRKKEKGDDG